MAQRRQSQGVLQDNDSQQKFTWNVLIETVNAAPARNMLKIRSLLNPVQKEEDHEALLDSPLTPYSDANAPTLSSIFSSTTTHTNTPRPNLARQDTTMSSRPPVGSVNFPPFEGGSSTLSLSEAEKRELAKQHQRFKVTPSGKDSSSLISNNTLRIPYSSNVKTFGKKTGRDAFEGESHITPPFHFALSPLLTDQQCLATPSLF